MERNGKRAEHSERRRRPILVLLFSLMPLLVAAGILAPGMVEVVAVEGQQFDPLSVRITRRLSRYAHQPLLLPRDFSVGFIPELLDLEHLFSRVNYMSDSSGYDRSRIPAFPRDFGDVIVLDDDDRKNREIVFKDPVLADSGPGQPLPPPAADLTPLGSGSPIGPGPRFDDYLGPYVDVENRMVVPEPSSGPLLALGLALLAALRRGRSRTGGFAAGEADSTLG
jgi:hypothetical protein